jgi:hypothetical protein
MFVVSLGGRLEEINLITHMRDMNTVNSWQPEGEAERQEKRETVE